MNQTLSNKIRLDIHMLKILVISFLILGFIGCQSYPKEKSSATFAKHRLSCVLITIDTCREDRIGFSGNNQINTPNLDDLAKNGLVFEEAVCQVPITLPSHGCLMTAAYPFVHGIKDNTLYYLPERFLTLAEVLQQQGYQTAAFIGAFPLDKRFGLNQGFDLYDDNLYSESKSTATPAETRVIERSAESVVNSFLKWFNSEPASSKQISETQNSLKIDQPFLAWLHLYDPHYPYQPPFPWNKQESAYDGEIAYVDYFLGELIKALKAKNILSDTLLIITSDHGESLGEHGESSHGFFVYEDTLKVPLLIYAPKLLAARIIKEQIRLTDLAPTLLDLLGLDATALNCNSPPSLAGNSFKDLFNSKGTVANTELKNKTGSEHDFIAEKNSFPESAYFETCFPQIQYGFAALTGIRQQGWKYIQAPQPELYDLQKDPQEKENLYQIKPLEAQNLANQLVEIQKNVPQNIESSKLQPDAEIYEKLTALGYLQPGSSFEDKNSLKPDKNKGKAILEDVPQAYLEEKLIDPKEGIKFHEKISLAEEALSSGNFSKSADLFAQVLEVLPDNLSALFGLGTCFLSSGQVKPALAQFEKAIKIEPTFGEALIGRGLVFMQQGALAKAEKDFEKAVLLSPYLIEGYLNLALVYAQQKEYKDAIESLQKFLQIKPSDGSAYYDIACYYALEGDQKEALQWFKKGKPYLTPELILRAKQDPDLQSLKSSEEFIRILKN